jgi:phosphotransferase system enzyme I (PtsP)
VLEAYSMLAQDRGWLRRMSDAVKEGLSSEAAVERVQNSLRARMMRQNDPYWRERQRDVDDLSDRLLRVLAGKVGGTAAQSDLPGDTILVARNLGPAELLDYDRTRLRGLVVEEGGSQSHVAIVAKALGIAAVGEAQGIVERVSTGDAAIVDAESGQVHLRPSPDVVAAYSDKVRFRARRQQKYQALRTVEPTTKDGVRIALHMNAGLLVDMPHLEESGADGVGLFRTELQFMLASKLPRMERQAEVYRAVLAQAGGRPVVFRSLDIGGDKVLPYLRRHGEDNPALGWRAIRMSLDRPALFRTQVRALLRAVGTGELRVMIPMVSTPTELDDARALIAREWALAEKRGVVPSRLRVGAMLEVPSLLYDLDNLMRRADFVSVGSNDLFQFFYASDRGNPRVSARYDPLSAASLRALRDIVAAARRHEVPLNLCGEMAGRPLEAMALIGLGFRSISMAPASIGPVKTMILSLDSRRIAERLAELLSSATGGLRAELQAFAEGDSIEI